MPEALQGLLETLGPALLFSVLFVDALGVPLLTESVLLAAGYLMAAGLMAPAPAFAAALAGAAGGLALAYRVGRVWGPGLLSRFGRYVGLSGARLERATAWVGRHGLKAAFLGRLLPVVRNLGTYPLAALGLPFGRVFSFSLAGYALWIGGSLLAGYSLGRATSLLEGMDELAWGVLATVAVFLAVRWLLLHRPAARRD